MVTFTQTSRQIPLIHFVESDDLFLADQPDVLWFDVLRSLDYHQFQATAAHYYEHLYTFNQQQKQRRIERRENPPDPNPETPSQATERLLGERATLDKQSPALYQRPEPAPPLIHIPPRAVAPGVTPLRLAGRAPKCFFSMLYAFLGTPLAGQRAEPQFVYQRLMENPAFARTCGFTIRRPGKPERQSDVPSLRKLQQFDQIMTDSGLWEELAVDRVAANLREGKIKMEATLVHDTTHYHAYSSMQMVDLPPSAAADDPEEPTSCKDSTAPATQPSRAVPAVKVGGETVAVGRVEVSRVPAGQAALATASTVPVSADLSRDKTSEADTAVATDKTAKKPGKTGAPKGKSPSAKKAKKKRKSHPRTTKNCRSVRIPEGHRAFSIPSAAR